MKLIKLLSVFVFLILAGCSTVNLSDYNQIMAKESADGIDCKECRYTLEGGASFRAPYNFADVGDSITLHQGRPVVIDYETGAAK
ncbi:MAG: hypothetical protein NTV06_06280 [candidate division Zixibacteria bacterium]|nr:hypothetical protein [candidate division Zixibacteria bacterium]